MKISFALLTVVLIWGCENFVDVEGYSFVYQETDSETVADGDSINGTDPDSHLFAGTDIATDTDYVIELTYVTVTDTGTDTRVDTATITDTESADAMQHDDETDIINSTDTDSEFSFNTDSEGCDDTGIDFQTDWQNCGGCGNNCALSPILWSAFDYILPANMQTAVCIGGNCEVLDCKPGYSNLPDFPAPNCHQADLAATWCETLDIPSDVKASDWQCLDFDRGLPADPWIVEDGAITELETAESMSAPASLKIGSGMCTWPVTGAEPITAVTISADIKKGSWTASTAAADESVNLLCVVIGNSSNCLKFHPSQADGKHFLFEKVSAKERRTDEYAIAVTPDNKWIHVELVISPTMIDIRMDGQSMLESDATPSWTPIKSETISISAYGSPFYYDNVTVAVVR